MANVLHPHIDFGPRPVSHASAPFGFGFGLGTPASSATVAGWQLPPTPGHTNPSAFHQLASSVNQNPPSRPPKRRHEFQDDVETGRSARDHSMDRSPTPERPKRPAPKRARVAPISEYSTRNETTTKEDKTQNTCAENDIDVGVLLASLPSQSLLPLLTSLIDAQPSLKSILLPLIPRPTVDTAIQALAQAAKKLRDAYPYSTAPAVLQAGSTFSSFGRSSHIPGFGQPMSCTNNSGMRDSYISSRLRPHITEFVAACFSYLPYFSSITPPSSASQDTSSSRHNLASQSTTLRFLHKGKSHPSESFLFLSAVTNHMLSQAPLTQSSLVPLLLPRLSEEWNAWVNRVDDIANREGGMFGRETVHSWERVLDDLAERKDVEGANILRGIRDSWVSKVGWLAGRTVQHAMEEL